MKKYFIFIILTCLFCFSAYAQDEWKIGQFVDQEGNALDIFFIQFTGVIEARYSHTFADNELMRIRNMRFSLAEGLYFETSDIVGYFDDDNVFFAVMPDETEEQYVFTASYIRRSNGMILLKYSDKLLEALLGVDVGMGFRTNAGFTCLFYLPAGFKESYEMLLSENEK